MRTNNPTFFTSRTLARIFEKNSDPRPEIGLMFKGFVKLKYGLDTALFDAGKYKDMGYSLETISLTKASMYIHKKPPRAVRFILFILTIGLSEYILFINEGKHLAGKLRTFILIRDGLMKTLESAINQKAEKLTFSFDGQTCELEETDGSIVIKITGKKTYSTAVVKEINFKSILEKMQAENNFFEEFTADNNAARDNAVSEKLLERGIINQKRDMKHTRSHVNNEVECQDPLNHIHDLETNQAVSSATSNSPTMGVNQTKIDT